MISMNKHKLLRVKKLFFLDDLYQCRLPTTFSVTRLCENVRYPKEKISVLDCSLLDTASPAEFCVCFVQASR